MGFRSVPGHAAVPDDLTPGIHRQGRAIGAAEGAEIDWDEGGCRRACVSRKRGQEDSKQDKRSASRSHDAQACNRAPRRPRFIRRP